MEIQDRNNILYQLLGNKASGVSTVSVLENGFVDMLKSYDASSKNSEKAVFETDKNVDVVSRKTAFEGMRTKPVDVKNVESRKKDIVKDTPKNENKPVQEKTRKEKVSPEVGAAPVEDTTRQTVISDAGDNVDDEVVSSVDMDQVEITEGEMMSENSDVVLMQDVLSPIASEAFVATENVATEFSGMGEEAAGVKPIVNALDNNVSETIGADNNLVVEEEIFSMAVEDSVEKRAPAPTVDENTSSYETTMTDEEFLLMRQAKYLDENITSDKKLKVNVSVQEEKIAAPVVKDVLHNRFEVDAVLRGLDTSENLVVADEQLIQSDVAENTTQTAIQNSGGETQVIADITATAALQASDEVISTPIDAVKISAVGKEAVIEVAGTQRSEAFARINETSSRDMYKGMGKEVVEQIKVNITKSAVKGVDTIEIQLKPEDLGKIQVKMHISKDGRLQAEIISGRQDTLDMLQKEISGLVKAFDDAGYETDSRSFSFNFQDENQAGKQQDDESGLLKFIGDTLEQEADGMVGNDNYNYDPALGLNIRV